MTRTLKLTFTEDQAATVHDALIVGVRAAQDEAENMEYRGHPEAAAQDRADAAELEALRRTISIWLNPETAQQVEAR